MIRRIILKPSGFAMLRKRSISKYQQYKATPKVMRVECTAKPKDSSSPPLRPYLIRHPSNKDGFFGSPLNNFTTNLLLQKTDLDDNDHLNVDFEIFVHDESGHLKVEKFKLNIDTSKPKDSVILKRGKTEIEVTSCISRDPDVRFRDKTQLCEKEQAFVTKRKSFVYQQMKKTPQLQKSLAEKDESKIPNIAIIGSGGGMRAVMGMNASMYALKELGIMNYAMYTAGLSGSSWYLMTLYSYDKQLDPGAVSARLCYSLRNRKGRTKDFLKGEYELWKIIRKYFRSGYWYWSSFNLTMKYGFSIGDIFLNEKDTCKWSEQATKLKDGCVPLPLIAALHVRAQKGIDDYNEWIELSPYEVFIPKYGAAIDMENFGDEFNGGFITSKFGEVPISYIQGICGSAYTILRKYTLSESKWSFGVLKPLFRAFFNFFDHKFVGRVPNWLHGIESLEPMFDDIDSKNDIIDTETKTMLLVDAGLAFNSPYPTVLHPSRKVDVIISFDFSDRGKDRNWPFGELQKASEWAKVRHVPFPKIESQLEEIRNKCSKDGSYDEVYVFPGDDDSPTVVHFVMISNLYDKSGLPGSPNFRILPDYATTKFVYDDEEFKRFTQLCMFNITHNEQKLYDCILSAIEKRK